MPFSLSHPISNQSNMITVWKVAVVAQHPEGNKSSNRLPQQVGFSSQYAALYCTTLYYEIMSLVITK
jgi:hypothetical protein